MLQLLFHCCYFDYFSCYQYKELPWCPSLGAFPVPQVLDRPACEGVLSAKRGKIKITAAQAGCGHGDSEAPFSARLPVLDHCNCWSVPICSLDGPCPYSVTCLDVLSIVMISVTWWKYSQSSSYQADSAYFDGGTSWVVFQCRGSEGNVLCANPGPPSEKLACRKRGAGLAFLAVFAHVL